MESSSSSRNRNDEHNAFSGIEPRGKRRKVDESSRLFDVFINHRGPDVKLTVALQLYNSLKELGIHAFLDSEEKELGDSFPSTIENAIHSASAHIAIFSKRYAESPWCLAELVLMLQSSAKIIPLFCGVKPSDLRYIEKGKYAEAFTEYKEKGRYMEKLKEWKEALQSVSLLTGHEISGDFNISDCQIIVSAVHKDVHRRKSLHVAKYPVGLHGLIKDFERRCLDQLVEEFEWQCQTKESSSEKAQIVGIFGMGGVGKTTLVKELFNRKRSQYIQTCFLFDVREAYASKSIPSLQMKLLKDLFQEGRVNVQSTEEGKTHIMDCIKRGNHLSFLIVLDDIDHVQQLDAFLIMNILNKSEDCLVIVTTRDVGVLINRGITRGYNLKGMDREDARELFSWHAFGQSSPATEYKYLVDSFVDVCGGLPLSLQVIGTHLHGRDQKYWSSELNKFRKILPRDIHKSLRISFEALDYEEKQIFLDIACFFVDKMKSTAMKIWEGSGWSAQSALETLKNKCLVEEISGVGFHGHWENEPGLRMHDHLRDMGREIAAELSHPIRLWRPRDLNYLESMGFQNILAQIQSRCFHSFFDRFMNCKVEYFLGESDVCAETSTSLLWLDLFNQQLNLGFKSLQRNIPSWVPLQNLVSLTTHNIHLKTLWQSNVQVPTQLKELQIYNSLFEEFPDISAMSNSLEKIKICNCPHLKAFPVLDGFKKLIEWTISDCPKLQAFRGVRLDCLETLLFNNLSHLKSVSGTCNLRKLVEVNITKCPKLQKLGFDNCSNLTNLVDLDINGSPVFEQLRLVGLDSLKNIQVARIGMMKCFELRDCRNLEKISANLNLEKLVSINIRDCPKLQVLPSFTGPSSLETVTIDGCGKLNELFLSKCQNLKRVTGRFDLARLCINYCPQLEGLPFLEGLTSLENITIAGCGKLSSLQLLKCQNLKQVSISYCPELEDLPSFACQTCLEEIIIVRCRKLQNITLPTTFEQLTIEDCSDLKIVAMICDRRECLEELSSVDRLSCLEYVKIQGCGKLQTIQGIDELHALKKLQLLDCSNAAIRNCILMLKSVPSELFVMGRAVEGALSTFNSHFFSDNNAVIAVTDEIGRQLEIMSELSAVIFCAVVVARNCTSKLMAQGERIITSVITGQDTIKTYNHSRRFENVLGNYAIMKVYKMGVKKGEEWKIQHVHTIIDRLYQK